MGQVHVWRSYPEAPYDRFACTVAYDGATEAGYKVIDFDASIADAQFLHKFAEHMQRPVPVMSGHQEGDAIYERMSWEHAGTEAHFEAAVRMNEGWTVFGKGRPQ